MVQLWNKLNISGTQPFQTDRSPRFDRQTPFFVPFRMYRGEVSDYKLRICWGRRVNYKRTFTSWAKTYPGRDPGSSGATTTVIVTAFFGICIATMLLPNEPLWRRKAMNGGDSSPLMETIHKYLVKLPKRPNLQRDFQILSKTLNW